MTIAFLVTGEQLGLRRCGVLLSGGRIEQDVDGARDGRSSQNRRKKLHVRLRFSQWEYGRASDVVAAYGPELDLRGRHVLDVGTGLGGKLMHYQQLKPASITTVDIRPDFSTAARSFVTARCSDAGIRFVVADAAILPFNDDAFDVVISNETFEHVKQPLPALREISRVTRPTGWVFISFPPYYSPWGAHLNNWVRLPWVQVIFSEQTLINAAVKVEQNSCVNRQMMPEARLVLRGCQTFPHINKMTLHRFEALLQRTPLRLIRRTYLSPGWRRWPQWHARLQPLTRFPGLREMFTSHAVYVLRK